MEALWILVIVFAEIVTGAYSQTPNDQNAQTFYPFTHPPPRNVIPAAPVNPHPRPRELSTRAVIAVTFACTLALYGIVLVLILWWCKRERRRVGSVGSDEEGNRVLPVNDVFLKWDLKGVIVDENGVDVVYWRVLEDGKGLRFRKRVYGNFEEEDATEKISRKSSAEIQELPLLRNKSSSSESAFWIDNDRKTGGKRALSIRFGNRAEPPPPQYFQADVQVIPKRETAPPPPPPPFKRESPTPAPPPPPPPIKNSPPPPQPPQSSLTAAAPPPPPPLPKQSSAGTLPLPPSKRPVPPLAPRPRPDAQSSSSSAREATSTNGDTEIKLKPLHWEKVNINPDHSMVWDKVVRGSFRFNDDLMESLFGYNATNKKLSGSNDSSSVPREGKVYSPAQIFILDPRKSQNTAIVLKSLGITRREIIDSVIEGQGLHADTIEKLAKIAPTSEETSQILAFDGDPTKLADAETFLYHLLKAVPFAFIRFKAMLFMTTYDSEISNIRESLQSLESACKELRARGLFLKLLEAVLKTGNKLNAGTMRGNAQAFNLTALKKLSDVKSSDGKTTLLQFVVQEVVRAEGKRCLMNKNRSSSNDDAEREYMIHGLPIVGGLSSEFSNVKKAATLEKDALVKMISTLEKQISEAIRTVDKCGSEGAFANRMRDFLGAAEFEIEAIKEEHMQVMEFVKRTTQYYHAGSSKDYETNPFQLFVIIRDFLVMVDQVCIEITRNVQKRKTVSSSGSSSSPPERSPRVFKIPKFPADLMSQYTDSSSSISERE